MTPLADRPSISLLRYAPAFVVLAIAIADAGRVADTDLWGHIAFGRLFLNAGPVSHDPFNYSVPGHAWSVHEWLAELLMARTYDVGGIIGLKLWKFASTSLTVIMLAIAASETGAPPMLQASVLIAVAVALTPMMQFRPQLYTYIFLAALMALLARENYRHRAPLWIAIPMLALWANLHGGFLLGVATLVIYTGVVTVEDIVGRRSLRRAMRLTVITVASGLATLINPYGVGAWTRVLGALHNPVTRKEMVDWQPLLQVIANSHGLHSGMIFFLLAVGIMTLLAIAFVITRRGGDLALIAIAAVMGAAAFDVVRNIPLAMIASVAPLTHHLDLIASRLRGADIPQPATPRPAHMNRLAQAVLIAAALVLTIGNGGLLSQKIPAAMDYPVGAISFMRSHQLHGNVLARFEWGQYVIFHMSPSSRVFIDGRIDLVYPPKVVHEYLDFFAGQSHGADILNGYAHDYVLMPPGVPAYVTMMARTDWKPIYRDAVGVLFARADSPAAHLPDAPASGPAPPSSFP
jgi:hypothetical protein